MKPVAFDYTAPRDVAAALAALATEGAKLIAGGQSLGPMLNLRLVRPRLVVDIARIEALRTLETRGDRLWIGAAVTHAEIEDRCDGMVQSVAAGIAYRSIRTRGTVGGSLAHADPAADWPLALAALGATIHIQAAGGRRRIDGGDFMQSAFTTGISEAELIEGVEVPVMSRGARWGYYKFCRKTGEFPEASAAIVIDPARRAARVYLGALNGAPRRCDRLAERLARGESVGPDDCLAAVRETVPDLDAVALRMHAAALGHAVRQAMQP